MIGHWSDIVSVLLGNGDGTFRPHIWFRTDRGPTGVALADFDGDGKADLASANYFSTTISVLPGNANGTFQTAQNFGVGMAPMGWPWATSIAMASRIWRRAIISPAASRY